MKRMIALGSLVVAAALAAAPVGATTHHRAHRRGTPCKQIREALESGKAADEVAKEFKVSADAVKRCQPSGAQAHKGAPTRSSKAER